MQQKARTRVSQRGTIAIPPAFLKALGVNAGDEVLLLVQGGELRITTQQRRIQQAQRRAHRYLKSGRSLVDELLAERRTAAKHE